MTNTLLSWLPCRLSLIMIVLAALLLLHWCSLVWYFVGDLFVDDGESWLVNQEIFERSDSSKCAWAGLWCTLMHALSHGWARLAANTCPLKVPNICPLRCPNGDTPNLQVHHKPLLRSRHYDNSGVWGYSCYQCGGANRCHTHNAGEL
jgi:hypothetical protein